MRPLIKRDSFLTYGMCHIVKWGKSLDAPKIKFYIYLF